MARGRDRSGPRQDLAYLIGQIDRNPTGLCRNEGEVKVKDALWFPYKHLGEPCSSSVRWPNEAWTTLSREESTLVWSFLFPLLPPTLKENLCQFLCLVSSRD